MKARKGRVSVLFLCVLIALLSLCMSVSASPRMNKKKATVYVGKTIVLKVKGSAKKISWSSSKKKIASVSKKGVVKGKKAGTAVITARVDGKKLRCKVNVISVLQAEDKALTIYGTGVERITFRKKGDLNYFVANPSILSCEWSGEWYGNDTYLNITGKKNGTTYVTVNNSFNSEKVRFKVTVAEMELNRNGSSIVTDIQILGNTLRGDMGKTESCLEGSDGIFKYRTYWHPNNTVSYCLYEGSMNSLECEVIYNPKKYSRATVRTPYGTAVFNPVTYKGLGITKVPFSLYSSYENPVSSTLKVFEELGKQLAVSVENSVQGLSEMYLYLTLMGNETYVLLPKYEYLMLRSLGFPNIVYP